VDDIVVLSQDLSHPEGPAILPDGRVVFVETFLGQLSVWDSQQGVSHYADVGGGPNACTVGLDGIVALPESGRPGIERRRPFKRSAGMVAFRWLQRLRTVSPCRRRTT
jgi:hypothetical protein